MGVSENFKTFCDNLIIDVETRSKISVRYQNITQRLNKDFRDIDSKTLFSRYVGSYGRGTAIKDFSDLDMIFEIPYSIFLRYDNYSTNGQSVLLQDVKKSIKKTYPNTYLGADGQVVKVNFGDNVYFEVVPGYKVTDRSYKYPDSNNGGSWKITNPIPEIEKISIWDSICNNNLKRLCKMTRVWKTKWNVPMGGLLIDTLAYNFLSTWRYRKESYIYYDWMSRDFFKYLSEQNPKQSYWYALGSNQLIYRKGLFEYRAKRCYNISIEAIKFQSEGKEKLSKLKWRRIYGSKFPI